MSATTRIKWPSGRKHGAAPGLLLSGRESGSGEGFRGWLADREVDAESVQAAGVAQLVGPGCASGPLAAVAGAVMPSRRPLRDYLAPPGRRGQVVCAGFRA